MTITRNDDAKCTVCDKTISNVQAKRFGTCGDHNCRCAHHERLQSEAKAVTAKQQQRQALFDEKLRKYRETVSESAGRPELVAGPSACVPTFTAKTGRVSEDRIERFRLHVLKSLENVEDVDNDIPWDPMIEDLEEEVEPTMLPVVSQACATCGGFCCAEGGDKAYLNSDVMRRYLHFNPEKELDTVVDDYLSYVPEFSHLGSCIYHGDRGCNLPRHMRADICNRFECYGLARIRAIASEKPPGIFVVSTENEEFKRHHYIRLS